MTDKRPHLAKCQADTEALITDAIAKLGVERVGNVFAAILSGNVAYAVEAARIAAEIAFEIRAGRQ